jgi:hypothetical protein
VVDLDDIAAGNGGFKNQGENGFNLAGRSVSAAGDMNGDGIDDLIVGSHGNSSGVSNAGAAYVVFGSRDDLFTDSDDVGDRNEFDLSLFQTPWRPMRSPATTRSRSPRRRT